MHDVGKVGIDCVFVPVEGLQILYPLKVRDGNAAGISQNVRYYDDTAFVQDFVAFWCGRRVSSFYNDGGLNPIGIFLVIWFSNAAGIRTSTSPSSNSVLLTGEALG